VVIGAFIGAFAGAALFEYTYPGTPASRRGRAGCLLGRAAGSAAKIALGLVLVVISVLIALS